MYDIVDARNGSGDIDPRYICHEKSQRIKARTLLMCRPNDRLIFPDLLTKPFLMYSAKLMQVVSIYQKDIPHKEVVLLEQEHGLTSLYFLPILPILDCVANPYRYDGGVPASRKPILDHGKCRDFAIFKFEDLSRPYTVMSLELIESVLVRKCVGLAFERAQMC
jgi:hypothetical protein